MRDAECFRFHDVVTFLTVHQTRSISAAARQLRVTPSQVSKAVARLESFVGDQLLARSPRGVAVSMAGLRAIPMLEEIARSVRDLKSPQTVTMPIVRIAAPSSLLRCVSGVLAEHARRLRFSCLELDPVRIRALACEDVYDVALLAEDRPLGALYTQERLGHVDSGLFGRPALAEKLGPAPIDAERLRDVPFVMPLLLQDTHVEGARDLCPLPFEQRTAGHSAATFGAALELAARSDHVVFGPRVAAHASLLQNELVEIEVAGWTVEWPLYFACHTTRVQARTARALKTLLTQWLEDAHATARPVQPLVHVNPSANPQPKPPEESEPTRPLPHPVPSPSEPPSPNAPQPLARKPREKGSPSTC